MAAESTTFSSSGEDVITRKIDVESNGLIISSEHFADFYEIERTIQEIIDGDFKRVALQFPDELLHDSVPIYRRLKPRIGPGRELYVLADTSYGSCCVDEVAAQHVDADAMVHYGHACMSQTSRLPVIYVFGKKDVDTDDCSTSLKDILLCQSDIKRPVLLRHDVAYTHQADAIATKLRILLEPLQIPVLYSQIPTKATPVSVQSTSIDNDTIENCTIFYIGGESLSLTNLLITHSSCDVYSYDPVSKGTRLESSRTNKLLMRRYAVVQKSRDADVFGILVGTLGVASYLPLIRHLRSLLSRSRKKSYTICVGKLNPSKLANFMEIECFVLVACPENSLIEAQAKDFLRPIVTPYELEIALQTEQSWTGRYVLDFERLLAETALPDALPLLEEDSDQPIFSLVTGKYRQAKRYGAEQPDQVNEAHGDSSALVLRNQESSLATINSAAGEFLQGRVYQGLEVRAGEDAPSVLEQGRSGIARGYRDDLSGGMAAE